jgi:RNA polymerase sigma factor (sigma-70 family)
MNKPWNKLTATRTIDGVAIRLPRIDDRAAHEVFQLAAPLQNDPTTPDECCRAEELTERFQAIFRTLPERTVHVIKRRFGIDGPVATLRECGIELGISAERVHQIEAKGMRQLSRPSRKRLLQEFVDGAD